MTDLIKRLEEIVAVQCMDGNWNANPYMFGMANGLILALHIMRDDKGDPPYKTAPDKWLSENKE